MSVYHVPNARDRKVSVKHGLCPPFSHSYKGRRHVKKYSNFLLTYFFNFKDVVYLFLERGRGREKEERNISVW